MADTFTPRLNLDKVEVGASTDTWGQKLNANSDILDNTAFVTTTTVALTSANVTLTAAQALCGRLLFTGALTANVTVSLPVASIGSYVLDNQTSGAFSVTVASVGAGANVTAPQGAREVVWHDGANVRRSDDYRDAALAQWAGTTSVALAASNVVLSATQAQSRRLLFTGTLTANVIVSVPVASTGVYVVDNQTTGAFSVTVASVGAGAALAVPQGRRVLIVHDGTNVRPCDDGLVLLALSLTSAERLLALANVGALGYLDAQTLSSAQRLIALANAGAVGYLDAQTLTAPQQAQARANMGVVPTSRNRHLNAGFSICQDRALGATVAMSASGYVMDGVAVDVAGGGVLTCSQVAKTTPGGSPHRLRAAVTTADASIVAGDLYGVKLPIEGVDVADLMFGSASALSFVWRGVVNLPAGTYGLAFRNGAGDRSYVTTFTVAAGEAGTDKSLTVTVAGDTAGTWIKDASGVGIWVEITFAAGSTYQTATTGAWAAGDYRTTSAQTNAMASTSNVFEIADVGLYAGSVVPSWDYPRFDEEFRKCCRYFWTGTGSETLNVANNTVNLSLYTAFPAVMRASPSVTASSSTVSFITPVGVTCYANVIAISWGYTGTITANARL